MKRNIILCADGTGNKGGTTPDSNVFKTYNAVDINDPSITQISFYDNGVGTATNKFVRAISGALGIGFEKNVRDLYTFLSKNYNPGADPSGDHLDRLYLFGFSRGAATIRAFNGFVHDCGLIDAREINDDRELEREVKALIKVYLRARYKKDQRMLEKLASRQAVEGCKSRRHKIDVEFIGVWDTVAALGMPKRTDQTGPISLLLNWVFNKIDGLFDLVIHHRSYNFQLTPNTSRACHAMSIDDARTAFWPRIWDERAAEVQDVAVDQIWFAGMHSDVGGGYRRQAMSNVSLAWILREAEKHGLKLESGTLDAIKAAANVHDKMHDSRDGFGMFYRYHPRHLESLCRDERNPEKEMLRGNIKIHDSVLSRMYYRTAGYAPYLLPGRFDVVDSTGRKVTEVNVGQDADWMSHCKAGMKIITWLKEFYIIQLMATLAFLGWVVYLWNCQIDDYGRNGLWGHVADILQYLLPDLFGNFIERWVYQNPFGILSVLLIVGLLLWTRRKLGSRLLKHALAKRRIIMDRYTAMDEEA